MPPTPHRIAMWSGPRNISTAMMRSWESRPDTVVCDEPLYGYWLKATGCQYHPGWQESLERHETDWRRAADSLLGPIPEGKIIFYQKHMAHHLLPEISRDWIWQLTNCFLIRDPYEMLTSLAEMVGEPRLEDTGLPQQVELFEETKRRLGTTPPVIDGHDVLADPPGVLSKLCEAIGIPFDSAMLSWEPGLRETDGAWAPYWYKKVAATTGFSPNRPQKKELPARLEPLLAECRRLYEQLSPYRIV